MPRTVALAVLAVLLAGEFGAAAGDDVKGLQHRRSERAFQSYVHTYVGRDVDGTRPDAGPVDAAWVRAHPGAALRAGDRACAWLRTQPIAPAAVPAGAWDSRFTSDNVLRRYVATVSSPDSVPSALGMSAVVAGAWEDLCWAERARRTARVGTGDD